MAKGEKLICSGTVNHLLMWDLRAHDITGSKMQELLDRVHITTNKNSLIGDKSALTPGGIRLGTPALTTRGMLENDMEKVAEVLTKALNIAKNV
jgi:glycine hydroxymethyltransferase